MKSGIGLCSICGKEFSKRGIQRHLKACIKKSQEFRGENTSESSEYSLLKIESRQDKDMWAYVYFKKDKIDKALDQFIGDTYFSSASDLSPLNRIEKKASMIYEFDGVKKIDIKICEESLYLNIDKAYLIGAASFACNAIAEGSEICEQKDIDEKNHQNIETKQILETKTDLDQASKRISAKEELLDQASKEIAEKVESMLLMYGVIQFKSLSKILEFQGIRLEDRELETILADAGKEGLQIELVDGGYYKSPEMSDAQKYIQNQAYSAIVYKLLPSQMLTKQSMLRYTRNIRAVKSFEEHLSKKFIVSDKDLASLMEDIIFKLRASVDDFEMIFKDKFDGLKFDRAIERNILKEKFMEMAVNLPLWILKGHSIAEADMVFGTNLNRYTKKNSEKVYSCTNKKKIGRNDPCPCGSGKKYKKCCGR